MVQPAEIVVVHQIEQILTGEVGPAEYVPDFLRPAEKGLPGQDVHADDFGHGDQIKLVDIGFQGKGPVVRAPQAGHEMLPDLLHQRGVVGPLRHGPGGQGLKHREVFLIKAALQAKVPDQGFRTEQPGLRPAKKLLHQQFEAVQALFPAVGEVHEGGFPQGDVLRAVQAVRPRAPGHLHGVPVPAHRIGEHPENFLLLNAPAAQGGAVFPDLVIPLVKDGPPGEVFLVLNGRLAHQRVRKAPAASLPGGETDVGLGPLHVGLNPPGGVGKNAGQAGGQEVAEAVLRRAPVHHGLGPEGEGPQLFTVHHSTAPRSDNRRRSRAFSPPRTRAGSRKGRRTAASSSRCVDGVMGVPAMMLRPQAVSSASWAGV